MKAIILSAVALWPLHASAQSSPSGVNACTLLKDPTELRDCLFRNEGRRLPPGPTGGATSARPDIEGGVMPTARKPGPAVGARNGESPTNRRVPGASADARSTPEQSTRANIP